MGRRILNRKELRADFDAAERRKPEDDEVVDEEAEGDEDEEEEEEESEEEDSAEAEEGDGEEGDAEDEDGAPVKKKKAKAKVKVKAAKVAKPKRTRTAKVVRMRLVWGVFNNSHQCVATYPYPKRGDADAHAAKLMADKKTTHFVQPVKEPMEEKKEKEKA